MREIQNGIAMDIDDYRRYERLRPMPRPYPIAPPPVMPTGILHWKIASASFKHVIAAFTLTYMMISGGDVETLVKAMLFETSPFRIRTEKPAQCEGNSFNWKLKGGLYFEMDNAK